MGVAANPSEGTQTKPPCPSVLPAVRPRTLITGAAGGIGSALAPALQGLGHKVTSTDIIEPMTFMDVTSAGDIWNVAAGTHPSLIFHLAGRKLAVEGELNPTVFATTNILGTDNICTAAKHLGARVVFASTCKAADPETAYGASKLICERVVLNAGGTVVRFFNVLESGPSVIDVWKAIPEDQPIPYTDCWRYFISTNEAILALITAAGLPSGRYCPDPGWPKHMRDIAVEWFPDRELVEIPRRRGDRKSEPLHAACETIKKTPSGLLQIRGAHDPA